MRVIIAGSRTFEDFELLKEYCDYLLGNQNESAIEIVSGCASGADALGERYARVRGYKIKRFPAPWDEIEGKPSSEIGTRKGGGKYWKLAGHFRNEQMAMYASEFGFGGLIAFWDGNSTGTKNMIDLAKKYKLLTKVKVYGRNNAPKRKS